MLFLAPGAPVAFPAPPRSEPGSAWPGLPKLSDLLHAARRQRSLLAWNRAQPRPAAFRHCPDRVWRRRSALLTLSSGQPGTRGPFGS